jgi:hypothetical protein
MDKLKARNKQRLFSEFQRSRDGYRQTPSKWFGKFKVKTGVTLLNLIKFLTLPKPIDLKEIFALMYF